MKPDLQYWWQSPRHQGHFYRDQQGAKVSPRRQEQSFAAPFGAVPGFCYDLGGKFKVWWGAESCVATSTLASAMDLELQEQIPSTSAWVLQAPRVLLRSIA